MSDCVMANCGNPKCSVCFPAPSDVQKLHGWITPEYALQMIVELHGFLNKNGIKTKLDIPFKTASIEEERNNPMISILNEYHRKAMRINATL